MLADAGDDVVLHGSGEMVPKTEEDVGAEDEFEALLSKTMSESVEKSKIARASTQVYLFGTKISSFWVVTPKSTARIG